MKGRRVCELCHGEAALFCPSDSAFLCCNCDVKVHEANFLVARHVRSPLCSECNRLITAGDSRISGVGSRLFQPICRICSRDDLDSLSSSACISDDAESSSSPPPPPPPQKKFNSDRLKTDRVVVSSTSSVTELSSERSGFPATLSGVSMSEKTKVTGRSRPPPPDSKVEAILVNWCRKLGLSGTICDAAVPAAVDAFAAVCEYSRLNNVPSRLSLTASFWFGLRFCGDKSASTWQVLKRLEEISGVPAKLISATESKLARALSRSRRSSRSQQQPVEGWAETQ